MSIDRLTEKEIVKYTHTHTHTHTHRHTYADIIQLLEKEILLFVTIWIDLESIMLSEVSQTGGGWGKWELDEGDQQAQTFSCKVNKY